MSRCHITAAGVLATAEDNTKLIAQGFRVRRMADDMMALELIDAAGAVLAFTEPVQVELGQAMSFSGVKVELGVQLDPQEPLCSVCQKPREDWIHTEFGTHAYEAAEVKNDRPT